MTEARFTRVYEEHVASIYRYCVLRTGSQADAEDVTAEVFARLLTKGSRVHEGDELPWLYAVARNACADRYRRDARHLRALERLEPGPIAFEPELRDRTLWRCVAALRGLEQQVIFLHTAEDKTFSDVARLLGRSEGAVKMAFHRGIRRLRAMLETESVVPAASHGVEGGCDAS